MPRLRQALSYVLASSLALVLWTVARPAAAAPAPFCDDRGASAIAPPPALEAPDVAVQRARVTSTCPTEDSPLGATLTHGRAPSAPAVIQAEPALLVATIPLPLPSTSELDPAPRVEWPCEGVRSRVERPPRG